MKISKTRTGLRLSQHGVIISEMRLSPGPTHSLFDVLAALTAILCPNGRVGLLGFAGGGMVAPLRSLAAEAPLHAIDLDAAAFELFRRHCRSWAGRIHWHHREASEWLSAQPKGSFDLIVEDLSVPSGGDVFKPAASWDTIPKLIRERLAQDGIAVFNLIMPVNKRWNPGLSRIVGQFAHTRFIQLDEFQNLIVVAGNRLPTASQLSHNLRTALAALRSRQANRMRVRSVHGSVR